VDRSAVHSVFEKKRLVLDGKEIEVKSAFKKIEEQLGVPPILPSEDSCKVFVGGINQVMEESLNQVVIHRASVTLISD